MKKLLSLLLVFSMVICIAPVFNLAVFADDVIEISSAEQFFAIEDNLGGNYKLTADITIKEGLSYREEGKLFTGTFDGDGHTITLDFVDTNGQRTGAFCSVDGCTIKNLKVDGRLVSTGNSTAALIGTVKNTGTVTIENVTTEVDIFANNSERSQGGIIGCLEDTPTVKLINCINNGDVMGECVGGLIGAVHGAATVEITGCTNNGDITNINRWNDYRGAAGFIGKVPSRDARVTIKSSTNNGDIEALYMTANAYVSHNNMNAGNYVVENCTNTGKVTSAGTVLPAEVATAKDTGTFTWGGISYKASTNVLSGSPQFHSLPDINGFKAYINGVEATDKVTLSVVEGGDRQLTFTADLTGIGENDLNRGITFVWANGTYCSFGTGAVAPKGGNNFITSSGGCGFIDSNLYLENGFADATELNDVVVTVNGKTAYWNKGYEGYRHCSLNTYDDVPNAHVHVGIVGADLVQGKNTLTLTCGDDVLTQYFMSTNNALGTSYAKVTADAKARTVVAEIAFNEDPGFAIGTTFEGRQHDSHNAVAPFVVTAYDAATGIYTIEAENYVPAYTLLELKVTSEGEYKDYWVTATINAKNGAPKAGSDVIAGSSIVPITGATSTFGDASKLVDSQKADGAAGGKLEGNWPGQTVTVTMTAEKALKLSYIVFFTDDDGSYWGRAPGQIKLYGSADNSSWTPVLELYDATIKGESTKAFAVDVSCDTAYQYYKLEILRNKDNGGYFQIEEILLLEGESVSEDLAAGVEYNGTVPTPAIEESLNGEYVLQGESGNDMRFFFDNGMLRIQDNRNPRLAPKIYTDRYTYSGTYETGIVVKDLAGVETDIMISLGMDRNPQVQVQGYRTPQPLVDAAIADRAFELTLGENVVEVINGFNGVKASFKAPKAGKYTFAPANGETNLVIMVETEFGADTLELPYTVELAKGEEFKVIILTENFEPDTVELDITSDVKTGDATAALLIVSAVALLGTALVIGKKRRVQE